MIDRTKQTPLTFREKLTIAALAAWYVLQLPLAVLAFAVSCVVWKLTGGRVELVRDTNEFMRGLPYRSYGDDERD